MFKIWVAEKEKRGLNSIHNANWQLGDVVVFAELRDGRYIRGASTPIKLQAQDARVLAFTPEMRGQLLELPQNYSRSLDDISTSTLDQLHDYMNSQNLRMRHHHAQVNS